MLCRQRVLAEVNTVNNTGRMTTTARGIAQWRGLRAGAVRWRDWGAANQCTACLDSSALLPLPGTMPARQPRVHGRQPPPRRAIIHTDTQARARGQTDTRRTTVPTRNEPLTRTPACMHRHTSTTTTTTPPHDGRSTTSSTHQPLLALSRHTHTHTHTCQPQHSVHAAIPYTQHSTSNDD